MKTSKICIVLLKVKKRTRSGPSSYSNSLNLLEIPEDSAIFLSLDPETDTIHAEIPPTNDLGYFYQDHRTLNYRGTGSNESKQERFGLMEKYFSDNLGECLNLLLHAIPSPFNRESNDEITWEEFEKFYRPQFPGISCSWYSRGKSARK